MTTPIDTTRLRERTEAVRDAGAVMRAAREHSDHALTAASADEYRKAAEAFRAAQKRLYADAPPDGIILALLDEVERLRAPVPRPLDEWHDDDGAALWWTLPVCEPPYSGAPGWSDCPGYHTHWTPFVCPREPEEGGTR